MEKKFLLDMSYDELKRMTREDGQPEFRAKQIFKWIHQGKEFQDMSNLPRAYQEKLSENYDINPVKIVKKLSSVDKTRKYLYFLPDSNIIEGVVMKYRYGNTICISSQVGCKMGCMFCASGEGGFIRNLSAGEMLGQVISAEYDTKDRISNIVVMGSGEPLDNYDELMKFVRLVNHPDGINIGARNITVSTCGLIEGINRLAEENIQINLAVSLHAPNDGMRERLMPIAKRYRIKPLFASLKQYAEKTSRRVTLEYAMIDGVNDSLSCAVQLNRLLKGLMCHINLIPLNAAIGGNKASTQECVREFEEYLKSKGVSVSVRRELGADIKGACGQLRRDFLQS